MFAVGYRGKIHDFNSLPQFFTHKVKIPQKLFNRHGNGATLWINLSSISSGVSGEHLEWKTPLIPLA